MTGRHVGPVLGIAGTGRPIRMDGIDHFVLGEATVISNTVVFDQLAFARQVGLLPADRTAADRALKGVFNARTSTRLVGVSVVRRRMTTWRQRVSRERALGTDRASDGSLLTRGGRRR